MLGHIKANNFDDLFVRGIYLIHTNGTWVHPRGFNCKEVLTPTLILTDPKRCYPTLKERKLNYAYLTIEKMMYLSGIMKEDVIISYNSKMKNYLNDNGHFDGAYGPRIKGQLDWVYHELKKDPDSRRAVVTIHDKTDNNSATKDSACTLSLHYMIRDGKLNAITYMRSNDILWGLCLDVPAFCFLQEVLAFWLGVEIGTYTHIPSSLHYYDTFEDKLLGYIEEVGEPYAADVVSRGHRLNLDFKPWSIPYNDTTEHLNAFWMIEEDIRTKGSKARFLDPCLDSMLDVITTFWDKKVNKE